MMSRAPFLRAIQIPPEYSEYFPKLNGTENYTFQAYQACLRDDVCTIVGVFTPKPDFFHRKFPLVFMYEKYCEKNYYPAYMNSAKLFSEGPAKYVYAVAFARGRCGSGGENIPLVPAKELALDEKEIIEALKMLPDVSSPEPIFIKGKSWNAYAGLLSLMNPHHLLAGMSIFSPTHPIEFFPLLNGIPMYYSLQWLSRVTGPIDDAELFFDEEFWRNTKKLHLSGKIPLRDWDEQVGLPSSSFKEWADHSSFKDPSDLVYWNQFLPHCENFAQNDIPKLWKTARDDPSQFALLEYLKLNERCTSAESTKKDFILITPFAHLSKSTENGFIYGRYVDQSAFLDSESLDKEWFDWVQGKGSLPYPLKEGEVVFHISGMRGWYSRPSIEEMPSTYLSYEMNSSLPTSINALSPIIVEGTLPVLRGKPTQFINDPYQTNSPFDECKISEFETDPKKFQTDQQCVFRQTALNNQGIILDTDPLIKDLVIAGRINLSLQVSLEDAKDTALMANFYIAVPPDIAVQKGLVRNQVGKIKEDYIIPLGIATRPLLMSHRNSLAKKELNYQSQIYSINFNSGVMADLIPQGARIRVIVSGLDSAYMKVRNGEVPIHLQTDENSPEVAHIEVIDLKMKLPILEDEYLTFVQPPLYLHPLAVGTH